MLKCTIKNFTKAGPTVLGLQPNEVYDNFLVEIGTTR